MAHAFLLLAILIVLFWAVGMATGMAAMIFYLGLEERYVIVPLRRRLTSAFEILALVREKTPSVLAALRTARKWVPRFGFFSLPKRVSFPSVTIAPE